jgi:hypothetical protein
MSTPNDGGPAFPTADANYETKYAGAGLSVRDYFAAKAMQGLLASNAPMTSAVKGTALVSQAAYLMADAMLEERSKA